MILKPSLKLNYSRLKISIFDATELLQFIEQPIRQESAGYSNEVSLMDPYLVGRTIRWSYSHIDSKAINVGILIIMKFYVFGAKFFKNFDMIMIETQSKSQTDQF